MAEFFWPLDHEADVRVRTKLSLRLAKRSQQNYEDYLVLPGMEGMSEREELAFYESKDDEYFLQLAEQFPQVAHKVILRWTYLLRKYRA